MARIGFMQGRLSPLVDGKIQAFPAQHWRAEFVLAERHGFDLMEWTLDHEGLADNPLMRRSGREEIKQLCARHGVAISSVTGDCFMQAPFYRAEAREAQPLHDMLCRVLEASVALGIRYALIPLVDNGRLDTPQQAERLHRGLEAVVPLLRDGALKIVFESDFPPVTLKSWIANYPARFFGINYDIGNSASLGFDPAEEIAAYGARIDNVHVKDRLLHGATVPLGTGAADLPRALAALKAADYRGNYILQTARVADGAHEAALCRYRDMVRDWIG